MDLDSDGLCEINQNDLEFLSESFLEQHGENQEKFVKSKILRRKSLGHKSQSSLELEFLLEILLHFDISNPTFLLDKPYYLRGKAF